jgi:DNA helicase IV
MRQTPSDRPYFNIGINEIRLVVQRAGGDPQVLGHILHELSFRTTQAAEGLKREITLALAQSGTTSTLTDLPEETTLDTGPALDRVVAMPVPSSWEDDLSRSSGAQRAPIGAVAQSEEWRVAGRRPWYMRVFGKAPLQVEIAGDSLVLRQGTIVQHTAISTIDRVDLLDSALGTRLQIRVTGDRNTPRAWPLMLAADARDIAGAITARRNGAACKMACDAFRELQAIPGYLNHRPVAMWQAENQELASRLAGLPPMSASLCRSMPDATSVERFRDTYDRSAALVTERNNAYVENAAREHADFFNKLERNPLTPRQVEAVLRDEDHSLVVAGAGTGKTSTVVGKVGFLLETTDISPEEILALAFARKAKAEMEERIRERTGHEIEVRTFHGLGRQIVLAVEGEKSAISSMAQHQPEFHHWISQTLSALLADPVLRTRYLNFAVYHRYPARYLEDFKTRGEYLRYMRKQEPQTLRGEWVKSFEELLIADWLTISGIRYEYEPPYEHNTATRQARQYKPDFYLADFGVYLEHFGIGRDGSTAPGINAVAYAEGIRWKRELHRRHGTKLVESYSYERKEGVLLQELERKLREAGVELRPLSDAELRGVVEHKGVKPRLVSLLGDFLTVYKANLWTPAEVRRTASTAADHVRSGAFLDLFEPVFGRYEARLAERREMDFSDMIVKATEYIEAGQYRSGFRRIIVDEFQDISRGRQRLLLALLRQIDDCRLMCVGDDWQSIFGFTGSDVGIMTAFRQVFGFTAETALDRTFRFNDALLRASSRFVQQNPSQLRKELHSNVRVTNPVIHVIQAEEIDLGAVLSSIDGRRTARQRASVLILGRYNFCEPEDLESVVSKFPMLDVQFMTVHKAKGLEADYVIILDVRSGRFGFPSEMESDPILNLVVPDRENFEHAEERRLFYVALTRARNEVFIIADPSRASGFVDELHAEEYSAEVATDGSGSRAPATCPDCRTGRLILKFPNRARGYAWQCDLWSYCEGKAKTCSTCGAAPLLRDGHIEVCADGACPSRQVEERRR